MRVDGLRFERMNGRNMIQYHIILFAKRLGTRPCEERAQKDLFKSVCAMRRENNDEPAIGAFCYCVQMCMVFDTNKIRIQ